MSLPKACWLACWLSRARSSLLTPDAVTAATAPSPESSTGPRQHVAPEGRTPRRPLVTLGTLVVLFWSKGHGQKDMVKAEQKSREKSIYTVHKFSD